MKGIRKNTMAQTHTRTHTRKHQYSNGRYTNVKAIMACCYRRKVSVVLILFFLNSKLKWNTRVQTCVYTHNCTKLCGPLHEYN